MVDWKSNAFFLCSCGPGEKSTSHFPAGRAGLSPHTLDGDSGAKLTNKDSNLRPSSELTSSEITCISNTWEGQVEPEIGQVQASTLTIDQDT